VGARGSGAAAKLVANLTLVGTMSVLGEAMALAEALSLPAETAFTILGATPLSAQARRRKAAVLSGDYPKRFSLALARKDARLIQEAASDRELSLPVVEGATRWLDEAVDAGLGDADYSALLGYIRSRGSRVS
jgi:3-hydroxyisobutyrate dehydrogenase/2-hydroxy-3-oxopropionate reductase